MCELLIERGADPDIADDIYNSPAHGWARTGVARTGDTLRAALDTALGRAAR